MEKREQEDQNSSDNEHLLMDEQDDEEGDQVHIQDDDDDKLAANSQPKKKKRLSKGGKKNESHKKDIKKREPKVKKGKQLQTTSTIENEGDEDLPDDAEKELPGDQEYSAKGEPSQEDEEDDDIEQDIPERTLNRQSGESDPKLPGNKKMKKRELINTVVNSECEELINEMNFATESDIESNRNGRPGLAKLKLVDKVITKLKNLNFADNFLENDGLSVLSRFISKLPDGSWPVSNVRSKILKVILSLPVTLEQLRSNNEIGRTIVLLQKSPKELEENKKIIRQIRDKWTRVATHTTVEYTNLEEYEKRYNMVPISLPRQSEEEENPELGKRSQPTEEELNAALTYGARRPASMGYNFTVRPESNFRTADRKKLEEQNEVNKLLTRMRRVAKHA